MFEKIFYFDLATLNWKGWLLFLVTCALFLGAAFLIAFEAEAAAQEALSNRGSRKLLGYVMIGGAAAFFVVARIVLTSMGVSIHRETSESSSDSR